MRKNKHGKSYTSNIPIADLSLQQVDHGCKANKTTCNIGGQAIDFEIWDSSSQELDAQLSVALSSCHVILLCFSALSEKEFDNIKVKWLPLVHSINRDLPFMLVATKLDKISEIRKKENCWYTYTSALKLARDSGAIKFVECSAQTLVGLYNVFREALAYLIQQRMQPQLDMLESE